MKRPAAALAAPPIAPAVTAGAASSRTPPAKWDDGLRVRFVKDGKRPGTASFERYEKYRHAKTVGEALKLGAKRSDLSWDFSRRLLEVLDATPGKAAGAKAAAETGSPAKRARTSEVPAKFAGPLRAVKAPSSATSLRDGVALGGGNGAVLPVAGFGTYKLKKGEAKAPTLEALRNGYRLIDTAQVYENEADIGAAIRESGISREEVCVQTKVWRSSHGYERTTKAINQSLKKLGLEYIDVYLIHWPGAKTGWPLPRGAVCPPDWKPSLRDTGTWRAMEDLHMAGKIKAIGVCNYSVRHLQQLLKTCRVKPMVNQVEFHPRLVQSELLKFCKQNGIVLQAYASLGSSDAGQAQAFFALPPVKAAAAKHKVTPAQVLLRWALEKGATVVPKSGNPGRIAENSKLFGFSLGADEVKAIDALHAGTRLAWKGLDPDTVE